MLSVRSMGTTVKAPTKRAICNVGTLAVAIGIACVVASCRSSSHRPGYFFSFEAGLEGWDGRGIDTQLSGSEIPWAIGPSSDRATDGRQSLRFFLDNTNDAGKIFVQRSVCLVPHRLYKVSIAFDFATADFGTINLFGIIAGPLSASPTVRDDLRPAARESTANGLDHDQGFVWLHKSYVTVAESDANGCVVVVVGIAGSWETARTYYLDALEVDFDETA
jgi:hypothetical protein